MAVIGPSEKGFFGVEGLREPITKKAAPLADVFTSAGKECQPRPVVSKTVADFVATTGLDGLDGVAQPQRQSRLSDCLPLLPSPSHWPKKPF